MTGQKTLSEYESAQRKGAERLETRLDILQFKMCQCQKSYKIYQLTFTLPVFLDLNPQG